MSWRTPRSLGRFCREVLPLMAGQADGKKTLKVIEDVVETDRWNSFDRFHETTDTLVRYYEEAGAGAEVHPIQTGGRLGSGRWIIHEAADVRKATLDVVQPLRQRVLDYKDNPWHIVQWSGSTPKGGVRCELVVIDNREQLEGLPAGALQGKIVLTSMNIRSLVDTLASKEAVGVITDIATPISTATAWTKFGWGGVPLANSAAHLVGLVLSEREGRKLRQLVKKHGSLTVHVNVEVHRYVGTHDMVSGLIPGGEDPQDELWVLAHSAEPGALDNASGVALCVEIARVIEGLIKAGALPRPKRTIRLLNAYECYGFFKYLEDVPLFQNPLAGVVIDTVGHQPKLCNGRLEWRSTIPMSAGFVDRVGESIIRSALKIQNPGYKLILDEFMSTSDTLIGDPKYGFPAPWFTTHHRDKGQASAVYHTSADTMETVSPQGLHVCAVAMAGYLYYLANAGTKEAVEMAQAETGFALGQLQQRGKRYSHTQLNYMREAHHCSLKQLQRFLWEGERRSSMAHFVECERQVEQVVAQKRPKSVRPRSVPGAKRVPRRTALLSPDGNNLRPEMSRRLGAPGLATWALFWADGKRDLAQIAELLSGEYGREVAVEKVAAFFEAHAELGYAELIEPDDMVSKSKLVADFKKLGIAAGMDLMVHSSLSRIGHVSGGAETVVEALLAAVGRRGTLMFPSFNHGAAQVYNINATPTVSGVIPDAAWRRPDALRSLHPTHALAAIGPRAEEFCAGHLEAGIWAQDSPIGRLVHGGGYLLALGVTHDSSTAYHVAEESVPSACNDPFGNIDKIVLPDGSVKQVKGLAWRDGTCPVPTAKIDEALDRRKLQKRGKVGAADCALVKALDLWKVRREQLKNLCPTCKIKPGYRK
jgi:aminoglycoside 3-N-acetyltransferase